jgi:hypothetical protein
MASHLPLQGGLTLYHGFSTRSTKVLMMHMELQSARKKAGLAMLPPLKVVLFADWPKFLKEDYEWYLKINPNGMLDHTRVHVSRLSSRPECIEISVFVMRGYPGKVPTFVDASLPDNHEPIVMWDSTAICMYLLERFDPEHLLLSVSYCVIKSSNIQSC